MILRALKKYGMILADNGSAWYLSGAPDSRWNNDNLATMRNLTGSAFEAVDESSLMVSSNSGEAKQPGVQATVTVAPGSVTLAPGATQQFTATVQNATSQSVVWAVKGLTGGSLAYGFIDATGLYTAPPSAPAPATVPVTATTIVTPSATGSASVTIRNPAPGISSVTPNPLATGSFTLTVNGTGFQSGAVARLAGITLVTTFVSTSRLTATGSTSTPGSAVPVTVLNPDGQSSNAYSITVNAAAAISVSVSPASASVRVGRTVSFTATVKGSSNAQVTWQVNGVNGGNSTVGTINSSGVYTAPQRVPAPATVTIRAVSVADPTKSVTATVTVAKGWRLGVVRRQAPPIDAFALVLMPETLEPACVGSAKA